LIIEPDNQLPDFSRRPLNGSASYHPGQLLVSSDWGRKLASGKAASDGGK
jgi:hypothetical protein